MTRPFSCPGTADDVERYGDRGICPTCDRLASEHTSTIRCLAVMPHGDICWRLPGHGWPHRSRHAVEYDREDQRRRYAALKAWRAAISQPWRGPA